MHRNHAMMRIAHVTATFPPYMGGTGNVCYHQARAMAQRGHEVHIFTAHASIGERFEVVEGVTVHRLRPVVRVGNAPVLPGLLGLRDFDVVHLHHPFIIGADLLLAATRLRGIPLVLTHHNDLIGDGVRSLLFNGYSAISAPLLVRSAARLLVVSLDYAVHCRLAPLFRRYRDRVVETPNGVDVQLFRPDLDGTAVRRRYAIPEEAPLALFVGALDRAHHFKGLGLLLRAFATVQRRDAMLLVVGDGELRTAFEREAATLGIAERVRFVGAVANAGLPPYYAAADLVVLPSRPPESFGMVLIEAMACGRPVLASDIPGVRAVVRDGETGLLLRPGDVADLAAKLDALLDDPARRWAMGRRGRAEVETRYAWEVIIPRLEAIYEEVGRHARRLAEVDDRVERLR